MIMIKTVEEEYKFEKMSNAKLETLAYAIAKELKKT